jgi:catechol 2,3-dioxygenase-like lactoylglutathione lyase family enzyme
MIKGMNHVGISVASLDRSIAFYRDVLGMRVMVEAPFDGEQYEKILALKGAKGRAVLLRVCDMQIELFEFSCPLPKRADPNYPVCNHGISHFCIEVTEIEREYERMKAAGVSFHCAPIEFFGKAKAAYGRDPDGNVFELWERGQPGSGTQG